MTNRKSAKGFTLAEVLVTLTIIGIVAALTIPALLQSTGQVELKTGFKKAMASLNQAIVLSVAQESVDATSCTNCTNGNKTGIAQMFISRMNVLTQNTTAGNPYFYTADGTRYEMERGVATCNATVLDPAGAACVVLVDINGDKLPNAESSGNSTTGAGAYVFKDRYRLVITGPSALPATNTTNTASIGALQQ